MKERGTSAGIFFAILGRGPRAFQIGKISAVNHYFGKFSRQTTAFLVSLKTKLAITHTIAIKLKENRYRPILNSDGSKIRLFEFTAHERGNR